jgi:hypothetical protein
MYCKLICILYALLCGQSFILVKSGCYIPPGDILLHPIDLELILLPVGQEVVDGVLQLTLVAIDP